MLSHLRLQPRELNDIHEATIKVLQNVGVAFFDQRAVEIFSRRGFKTDGTKVFFAENQIGDALESALPKFEIFARASENKVMVGGNTPVLAPGYGAPFILSADGHRRPGMMKDYENFCKLAQTSPHLDMNGYMMVEPNDLRPNTAHLDMLLANILLCDKPFMASPVSKAAAQDSLSMAKMIFGSLDKPVMISNINALAPLQFTKEMTASLMIFAQQKQPVIITGGGMMGANSPIRAAGHLVVQNAAVLAGFTLTQLVSPGAPVVYGATGGPLDLRTGAFYIGAPEVWQIIAAGAQIAHHYGLPCRSGGSLTDSFRPDAQAGYESAMGLSCAFSSDVDFVLHAMGTLGTYIAISFEKFLLDEDFCGALKKASEPLDINSGTIAVDTIEKVGSGGNFLGQPETLQLCRRAFYPWSLKNIRNYTSWSESQDKDFAKSMSTHLEKRLKEYKKPDLGSELEKNLRRFVETKKNDA
jgi:trimethylamine---corrinoid protein Co-methyltransferase